MENVLTYAQFGAKGDGVTDDFVAIQKTHEEANRTGAKVLGDEGATYLIREVASPAIIRTDVDWRGAHFIIDNRHIHPDSPERWAWIFELAHDRPDAALLIPEGHSLTKGQANVGIAPGAPSILYLKDDNDRIYSRWGENANGGVPRQEVILTDAEGNVDPKTPIQYDYKGLTSITAYASDDRPITVENGEFLTVICDPREIDPSYTNHYCYHNRGIHLMRSNVVMRNVNHDEVGEHETVGVPYNAFYRFDLCANVELRDCLTYGQREYSFMDINKHTGAQTRNAMGSYEINMSACIDVRFIHLTQREDPATGAVITNRQRYHGTMGSNFCRDLLMEDCYVDRFDSHQGAYNATVRRSTIGFSVLIIGAGTLLIEDCTFIRGYGAPSVVHLRGDYNSIFDGDVIVRNCVMEPTMNTLVDGWWRSFYGGLPNRMINTLTVDGLTVKGESFTLFNYPGLTKAALTDAVNPVYLPTKVTVRGVNKPVRLCPEEQAEAFADTVFDIE